MRATVLYGAGDVRIETVPDAHLVEPTDAVVRVSRSAICGSDLWPYKTMPPSDTGRRITHEPTAIVATIGPGVRTVKAGDPAVIPLPTPAATAASFPEGCQRPASTAGSSGR